MPSTLEERRSVAALGLRSRGTESLAARSKIRYPATRVGHLRSQVTGPPLVTRSTARQAERLGPSGRLGRVPGTIILVLIFLAAFITYYLVNRALLFFLGEVG